MNLVLLKHLFIDNLYISINYSKINKFKCFICKKI